MEKTVNEFLQVYRSTSHSTTGISPCELLVGRKMRTRLNILPLLPFSKDDASLSRRVTAQQNKMRTYTDFRRGVRVVPSTHAQITDPPGHRQYTERSRFIKGFIKQDRTVAQNSCTRNPTRC